MTLQAFASATDVDGNSLLDNTIVVYVTEVARAWDHNQMGVPVLLFGGKNTRLRGGHIRQGSRRVLARADRCRLDGRHWQPAFNDLWLALAPVFGVNLTSLGNQNQYTGPLPGVFS